MNPLRIVLCLALTGVLTPALSGAATFNREIAPLLREYCFDCHDADSQKGGLDLSRFTSESAVMRDRAVWKTVFDMVESGQMPPPRRKSQPGNSERARLLAWIKGRLTAPDPVLGAVDPGKPVLRRLNRLEYNNTLRDLLGLEVDLFMFPERLPVNKSYFDPAAGNLPSRLEISVREYGQKYPVLLPASGLPGDNRAEHGFNNRGDVLNVSPLLLERYVALAGEIVNHPELPARSPFFAALLGIDPATLPKPAARRAPQLAASSVSTVSDFAPRKNVKATAPGSDYSLESFAAEVARAFREGTGGVLDFESAVNRTVAGKGEVLAFTIGAAGAHEMAINPNEDLWIASFATAEMTSGRVLLANKNKREKVYELTFESKSASGEGVIAAGVCLLSRRNESGPVTLTATFSNGTTRSLTAQLPAGAGAMNTFAGFKAPPGTTLRRLKVDGSQFGGDYVLADDLGFLTSFSEQLNREIPATDLATATPEVGAKPADMPGLNHYSPPRARLSEFVERAFRRPISAAEVDRYFTLFQTARQQGANEADAMRRAAQAVLASPGFLYLTEPVMPGQGGLRALDPFELASRLSYFLWSSAPDAELLAVARAGQLTETSVLEAQARRMLRDRRVRELSENFAVQWLRLDQLYTAKPDAKLFRLFYSGAQGKDTLHASMLVEALLLFETVLIEDRSILEFIHADYTWLNPRLARLYSLPHPAIDQLAAEAIGGGTRELPALPRGSANDWRRTSLTDSRRGGILTMGGPLTVTSLPFRTSPVKRGVWLLETVFNRPPLEPKEAFVLKEPEPGHPEPQTVRQRFEQHRSNPACYSCHSRIDPPGFALERFDPIGAWRERDGELPVDAAGEWNGRSFDGPAEFKAAIAAHPAEFVRGFVEHLLSYALGRKLEFYDLAAVEQIQSAVAANGCRFSSVVVEIVKSHPFRQVRNETVTTAARE